MFLCDVHLIFLTRALGGSDRQTWIDICQRLSADPHELINKNLNKIVNVILDASLLTTKVRVPLIPCVIELTPSLSWVLLMRATALSSVWRLSRPRQFYPASSSSFKRISTLRFSSRSQMTTLQSGQLRRELPTLMVSCCSLPCGTGS